MGETTRVDVYDGIPVTGEAVALDLRFARLGSRTVALLIDLSVQLPLLWGMLALTAIATGGSDVAITAAVALAGSVAVIVVYPTLLELFTNGRSLGKLALGLRVVREDGGPVRFRHVIVRQLFMVFDFWLTSGALGLFVSLLSSQGKRSGDYFAGTIVISERVTRAARLPVATPMPAGMARWAAAADLTGISDAAAGQARSLLGRWHDLDPVIRERLARQLAEQFCVHATPAPTGCHPATYLAAVVAERARRSTEATYTYAPPPHGAQQIPPGQR